jgi:LAO/AO transport system kinase
MTAPGGRPVGELLAEAREGRRPALARLLSMVERGGEDARAVGACAHGHGGTTYTVGMTGAPGAGKSTLTNALCRRIRDDGDKVAVLAVDPSSPFSGGAILGDRVRMGDHTLDDGVFIRSMATRGHLGGLALATPTAVRVLDAVGYPWVVIETVGVGQVEVEIAGTADTTVVVVNPGWGDAIQANKAGLMEIADVFVVNKADRSGAAETVRDLEQMLSLSSSHEHLPSIVQTVATDGTGIDALWDAIGAHRDRITADGELTARRRLRIRVELGELIASTLAERARVAVDGDGFDAAVDAVCERTDDPWTVVDRLLSASDE